MLGVYVFYGLLRMVQRRARKNVSPSSTTHIMITGGAQGLGKLTAEKFVGFWPRGNLILSVVDIRQDLAEKLLEDVKKIAKDSGSCTLKSVKYYNVDLS